MFQVCYFKARVSFSVKIKDLGAYGMLFCMYNKGSGIPLAGISSVYSRVGNSSCLGAL